MPSTAKLDPRSLQGARSRLANLVGPSIIPMSLPIYFDSRIIITVTVLPRDAMQARHMPSCGVRPSVCPSVCPSRP